MKYALIIVSLVLIGAGCTSTDHSSIRTSETSHQTSSEHSASSTTVQDKKWKTHASKTCDLSFQYPEDWTIKENAASLMLSSPETKKAYENFINLGILGESGAGYDISIECWPTLAAFAVTRSEKYTNLKLQTPGLEGFVEMIADDGCMQRIGETSVGGLPAYDVTMCGLGSVYEIWLEHRGITTIAFPDMEIRSDLHPEQEQILSSLIFMK